jgi:hypothetical protein
MAFKFPWTGLKTKLVVISTANRHGSSIDIYDYGYLVCTYKGKTCKSDDQWLGTLVYYTKPVAVIYLSPIYM